MTGSPLRDHLATLPPAQAAALEGTWHAAVRLVPAATEALSYGMPTLRLPGTRAGKPGPALFSLMGFRRHSSLFPHSGGVIDRVGSALDPYATTRGTLHFGPDAPFPTALLRRVIAARIDEVNERIAERGGRERYHRDGSLHRATR